MQNYCLIRKCLSCHTWDLAAVRASMDYTSGAGCRQIVFGPAGGGPWAGVECGNEVLGGVWLHYHLWISVNVIIICVDCCPVDFMSCGVYLWTFMSCGVYQWTLCLVVFTTVSYHAFLRRGFGTYTIEEEFMMCYWLGRPSATFYLSAKGASAL